MFWILLAGLATILSAFHFVFLENISKNKQYINIALAFVFLIVGIFSLTYLLFNAKSDNIKNFIQSGNIIYSILIALLIISFNVSRIYAVKFSPNPAFVLLIINLNILVVLLLRYLLYNKSVNLPTSLGILISMIGLILVICNADHK